MTKLNATTDTACRLLDFQRKTLAPVEMTIRMKAPKTDGVSLYSSERPVDYGHCCELMVEKYGQVRGLRAYEALIDRADAVHFSIATRIQMEKRVMLNNLKLSGRIADWTYQQLWAKWVCANDKASMAA